MIIVRLRKVATFVIPIYSDNITIICMTHELLRWTRPCFIVFSYYVAHKHFLIELSMLNCVVHKIIITETFCPSISSNLMNQCFMLLKYVRLIHMRQHYIMILHSDYLLCFFAALLWFIIFNSIMKTYNCMLLSTSATLYRNFLFRHYN